MEFYPEKANMSDDIREVPYRKEDNPRGACVVFGGQAGSEGKGAIAGYLSRKYEWGAAICTFMTNAGHTWVGDDGTEVVVNQLPVGLVGTPAKLLIGPGAAITESFLEREMNAFEGQFGIERRLRIHPRVMMIEEEDRLAETVDTKYIASTMKGCGTALARKVSRKGNVKLARDVVWLQPYIADTTSIVNGLINQGKGVLVEAAQGFDLDINHGISYPYCTSRGTTPMQVLADCGIDGRLVTRSIAVLRTFPIRVGNVVEDGERVGYSGPFGGREISFSSLGVPDELTTVTKRVRRIFEMDYDRIAVMSLVCRPTDIALCFMDYVEPMVSGRGDLGVFNESTVIEFVHKVTNVVHRSTFSPKVSLVKTGPKDGHLADNMGSWTV